MVERRLDHARMRASRGAAPDHEILVTSIPERFNEVAEIVFGETVPEIREINLWD
jgi:hypothetical protein